jgi:FkbM family methyltransferase
MNRLTKFLRKVRIALTPRSWRLYTRLANGATVSGLNRPGYGGRQIYILRETIEPEFEVLEQFLAPGGIFMDIGGNTGVFTMKAAQFYRQNGGGTVITYEPLPEMLAELNFNLRLNRFENVRLCPFCLGEKPGRADFWINLNRPASSGLVANDPSAARVSTVVFRLDDVFPMEKLDRLDYVKIDVEGAEDQVLAGARETLKKYRPIVQMEIGFKNAGLGLPDYVEWRSPRSPNKVCIPSENPKNEVAQRLGWQKL